jgi:hypothetical protein
MNTNEISPKENPRFRRIQKVSMALRTFFLFAALLAGLSGAVEIIYGLVSHQVNPATKSVAIWVGVIMGVINLVWAVCLWFAYRLFRFYACGELFSSGIVRCLRRIGTMSILIGILSCISGVIQFAIWAKFGPMPLHFWSATVPLLILNSFYKIIPGIAIICIAWIMDEGRKIQEEQELTV